MSTATTNQYPSVADAGQRARQLVPFSADSELWPYPRAPLNDNDISSDADVIELDFSDTRALSDPSLFQEKQTKQAKNGDRRKKSRKERAAERQKEREAIEKGWDDPTKGQVTINGTTSINSQSLSLSALMQSAAGQHVNGHDRHAVNGVPASQHTDYINGTTSSTATSPTDAASEALLSALSVYPKAPARDLSRKQFVQEILTLIYVSCSLVALNLICLMVLPTNRRIIALSTSSTRNTAVLVNDPSHHAVSRLAHESASARK